MKSFDIKRVDGMHNISIAGLTAYEVECVLSIVLKGSRPNEGLPVVVEKRKPLRKASNKTIRRFTSEQVRTMRKDREAGATYRALSELYGVTEISVRAICTRKNYTDVI